MGKIINIVVFVLMTGSFSLYAAGILKLTKTEKGEIQWGITPENARLTTAGTNPFSKGERVYHAGNYGEALKLLAKAVDADPQNEAVPEAQILIASCHNELGNKKEALAVYKAFIAKYPTHTKIMTVKKKFALLGGEI
jgi:tetratricopeptide (TPR) repeat protein